MSHFVLKATYQAKRLKGGKGVSSFKDMWQALIKKQCDHLVIYI